MPFTLTLTAGVKEEKKQRKSVKAIQVVYKQLSLSKFKCFQAVMQIQQMSHRI